MVSFVFKNCTRTLDSDIHNARIRYAQERLGFHSFFANLTVPRIQDILRAPRTRTSPNDTRRDVVGRLFRAQRRDAHDLWSLLLVQACEAQLVERRLAISTREDERLDALVLETFLAAVANLPWSAEQEDLQSCALRTSGAALREALRTNAAPKRATTVHGNAARTAGRAAPQLAGVTTPALARTDAK